MSYGIMALQNSLQVTMIECGRTREEKHCPCATSIVKNQQKNMFTFDILYKVHSSAIRYSGSEQIMLCAFILSNEREYLTSPIKKI
jgi:hypothetical protein